VNLFATRWVILNSAWNGDMVSLDYHLFTNIFILIRCTHVALQIIDPWGAVIAQCSRGEGICVAEVDSDLVQSIRAQMPVQYHRRDDVYALAPKSPNALPSS
jgi:hypothetical protein